VSVLQCVAVCWGVLQCVVVCSSVLQCVYPLLRAGLNATIEMYKSQLYSDYKVIEFYKSHCTADFYNSFDFIKVNTELTFALIFS